MAIAMSNALIEILRNWNCASSHQTIGILANTGHQYHSVTAVERGLEQTSLHLLLRLEEILVAVTCTSFEVSHELHVLDRVGGWSDHGLLTETLQTISPINCNEAALSVSSAAVREYAVCVEDCNSHDCGLVSGWGRTRLTHTQLSIRSA